MDRVTEDDRGSTTPPAKLLDSARLSTCHPRPDSPPTWSLRRERMGASVQETFLRRDAEGDAVVEEGGRVIDATVPVASTASAEILSAWHV